MAEPPYGIICNRLKAGRVSRSSRLTKLRVTFSVCHHKGAGALSPWFNVV